MDYVWFYCVRSCFEWVCGGSRGRGSPDISSERLQLRQLEKEQCQLMLDLAADASSPSIRVRALEYVRNNCLN